VKRGNRIVLVSHCLLNANARVAGIAAYEGVHPVIAELAARGYGIVQLACPEVEAEGCARPPQGRENYDTELFKQRCAGLASQTAALVDEYARAGTETALYVGVEGSPTCGVTVTNIAEGAPEGATRRVAGSGVLTDALRTALASRGVVLVGVDSHEPDLGVARVLHALDEPGDA
jgi:predicted secreted protein